MSASRHAWFWLTFLGLTGLTLYLLGGVLTPFVAGMAVAYLLDPVVDGLERRRLSRTMATSLVTLAFCLVVALVLVLLLPVLAGQLVEFAKRLPSYLELIRTKVPPLIDLLRDRLPEGLIERLQSAAVDYAAPAANWLTKVVVGVIGGGMILVDLISLIVIMPIVAFYLLRDWDRLVARIDALLPRRHADTIREQARAVDTTLSGFLRGQSMVCLLQGMIYGVGLSLVGLDFGLVVGLFTGFIAFIPYAGMALGMSVAVALALIQFGTWQAVGWVMVVFAIGQFIESYLLTPRLVGDRVGLHPIWVIFALMAGGALFGFVGVLLAVPAAAVIGVGVRFALARYLASPFYHGPTVHEPAVAPGDHRTGSTT